MSVPLSILDLAPIAKGQTTSDSFAASVRWPSRPRSWATTASGTPSTTTCRPSARRRPACSLPTSGPDTRDPAGVGGVMLPNHSPLVIAEQFGTLAALHPGRIDLGLGRAPGTDQQTTYALRRDPRTADRFPQDVVELQAYLRGETKVPGVDAYPGKGSNVPLYILGSSLFGAQLAGRLACPTRSRRTSRRSCSRAPSPATTRVPPIGRPRQAVCHRRGQRLRRRHQRAGEEQLAGDRPGVRSPARPAPRATQDL